MEMYEMSVLCAFESMFYFANIGPLNMTKTMKVFARGWDLDLYWNSQQQFPTPIVTNSQKPSLMFNNTQVTWITVCCTEYIPYSVSFRTAFLGL